MFQNLESNRPNTHAKFEIDWFSRFLKNWGRGINGFVDLLLGFAIKKVGIYQINKVRVPRIAKSGSFTTSRFLKVDFM